MQALFYQPHFADLELSSTQWSDRIDLLNTAGIKDVYLQWTDYGEVNFTELTMVDKAPFLPSIAELLRQKGSRLHVGLVADPHWFTESKRRDAELRNYLAELRQASINHASQIVARFPNLLIAGWYLPEEIGGGQWRDLSAQALLKEHFQLLAQSLHELTPGVTISVSGFSSGMLTPEEYSRLWKNLLEVEGLRLWHQDGSGTQALEFEERNALLKLLAETIDHNGLGVIAELFRQQQNPSNEFEATAANIKPLSIQLQHRREVDENLQIAGFSLRYFFENDGELINDYMTRYCQTNTIQAASAIRPVREPGQAQAVRLNTPAKTTLATNAP